MQTEEQVVYAGNPFGETPDTPTVSEPKRQADANRVTVLGASLVSNEYGTRLRVELHSEDTGIDFNHDINLPQSYVDNVKVDATQLQSSDNWLEDEKGQYAKNVMNDKRSAFIIRYLDLTGKDLTPFAQAKTIEGVTEAFSGICAGLQLLVVRKPNKNNFLNVSSIESIEKVGDAKYLARLAKADVAVRWL